MTRAKKINGRKRHIVVDTLGLLLVVLVSTAAVRDRDGARPTLKRLHAGLLSVSHIWADGGYAGRLLAVARSAWKLTVEIIRRPAGQKGFVLLPRRWVLERTFSWLYRWRVLRSDYQRLPETHETLVKRATIGVMLNRL